MTDLSADPRRASVWLRPLVLALLLATPSCVQQVQRGTGETAVGPAQSVERFLEASNARDYEQMARLFGTPDGAFADTGGGLGCAFRRAGSWVGLGERCRRWQDVELQMAAISDILRHQGYRVVSERQQPGRSHPTNRIGVDLDRGAGVVRDVPFLVVQTRQRRWLVQEIELQRVTGGG